MKNNFFYDINIMEIVDPHNGENVLIHSERGRELLKLYIMNYSMGGSILKINCEKCQSDIAIDKKLAEASSKLKKKVKTLINGNLKNLLFASTAKKYVDNFLKINSDIVDTSGQTCLCEGKKMMKKLLQLS